MSLMSVCVCVCVDVREMNARGLEAGTCKSRLGAGMEGGGHLVCRDGGSSLSFSCFSLSFSSTLSCLSLLCFPDSLSFSNSLLLRQLLQMKAPLSLGSAESGLCVCVCLCVYGQLWSVLWRRSSDWLSSVSRNLPIGPSLC